MNLTPSEQFSSIADELAARRPAILLAWRKAARADSGQTTGRSLSVGQLLDHIPEILDAFELQLRSRRNGADARAAEASKKMEEVKHGLHRWQQGYRLKELISECGHLQACLFDELALIADDHPEFERGVVAEANRQILVLINDTISESAAQYERMQQAEAAGHVGDLRVALAGVREIERRRSELYHQAVHDLRNDVAGVHYSAQLIGRPDVAETSRAEFAGLLHEGVRGLTAMLEELMDLARLEAGQEKRRIARLDAAKVIRARCDVHQVQARERELFLEVEGPDELWVEGDADKLGRVLQNLLTNAVRYTEVGGVSVSWGVEKSNWWLMIKDTGPGLMSKANAPLVLALQEATASAKDSDEKSASRHDAPSNVLPPPEAAEGAVAPTKHQPGEGIGLSIVKRLCELLDASLEIASSAESGTTFRVVFPLE
jgi:signal transduction histidine kinase